jgi:hypothetical protein
MKYYQVTIAIDLGFFSQTYQNIGRFPLSNIHVSRTTLFAWNTLSLPNFATMSSKISLGRSGYGFCKTPPIL